MVGVRRLAFGSIEKKRAKPARPGEQSNGYFSFLWNQEEAPGSGKLRSSVFRYIAGKLMDTASSPRKSITMLVSASVGIPFTLWGG